MYENGNSLHRLVDDLLSVQKIEAGMMKLCLSEVNVVALLKETATTFRQMAVSRKIDFVLDLPDKSIPLWVDIEKVLLLYAIYCRTHLNIREAGGNITLAVMENTMDEKDYCRIVVSDTGRGFRLNCNIGYSTRLLPEGRPLPFRLKSVLACVL